MNVSICVILCFYRFYFQFKLMLYREVTLRATLVEEVTGMKVIAEATVHVWVFGASLSLATVYGPAEFYQGEDIVVRVCFLCAVSVFVRSTR